VQSNKRQSGKTGKRSSNNHSLNAPALHPDCFSQKWTFSEEKKGKSIIGEIDCVLTQHYSFTDEELDFNINFDIKYRIGRDSSDEDE
jgi:hypothetical protein